MNCENIQNQYPWNIVNNLILGEDGYFTQQWYFPEEEESSYLLTDKDGFELCDIYYFDLNCL